MKKRIFVVLILIASICTQAWATQFKLALPGYKYKFPADHAAHDGYKTEWWYYTGHLQAKDGRQFGYELTFFRLSPDLTEAPSRGHWRVTNLYMAHFAVSDVSTGKFYNKHLISRSGVGFAGANTTNYNVWLKNWTARLIGNKHILKADSDDCAIDLALESSKPPAIHGVNGVSQKASCYGCASHYYSYTRMKTSGTLTINHQNIPVEGISWMDHEFGSNQLTAAQTGWDWFSLQLDNDTELMLYQMRTTAGKPDPNSSGTVVWKNGSTKHLKLFDYSIATTGTWSSPNTKAVYPQGWKITVPSAKLDLTVTPQMHNQELVKQSAIDATYWEGTCTVQGTCDGKPVKGSAYVEMTGYAETMGRRL